VLRIVEDGTPSSGANLQGMQLDFDAALFELEEIEEESIIVERTAHAESLLRVSCRAAPGVSLASAAAALRELWLSNLRYGHVEAHELHVSDDYATLDFITEIGPQGFYVTGQVKVTPG
jgi:hypothetical protein